MTFWDEVATAAEEESAALETPPESEEPPAEEPPAETPPAAPPAVSESEIRAFRREMATEKADSFLRNANEIEKAAFKELLGDREDATPTEIEELIKKSRALGKALSPAPPTDWGKPGPAAGAAPPKSDIDKAREAYTDALSKGKTVDAARILIETSGILSPRQ
jgi:hypothetical protein